MNHAGKPSVLFVCTGNAGRSQMAQAMFRQCAPEMEIESAGVEPWAELHPRIVALMGERGIALEGQRPKHVDTVAERGFDWVVTIGDPARARLPRQRFSATYWMHWAMADPADADGTPEAAAVFRRTMAAIESRLPALRTRMTAAPRLCAFARQPGISTGLWGKERFVPARHLPSIHQAGFRAIELNLYRGTHHFDGDDAAAVRALRRTADGLGLLVWSIHAPDLGNLTAADEKERRRQLDGLKRCLELAGELGARAIASHALLLGRFTEDPEGCEARLAEAMAELGDYAEGGPAQLACENAGFPAGAATRTWRLLARLDAVSRAAWGLALDTGHAHLDGDLAAIEAGIGDQLVSVHLNDNDGQRDLHLAPGEGTVDWAAVKRLLAGFRGVAMYEIEPGEFDPLERLATTMAAHRRYLATDEED